MILNIDNTFNPFPHLQEIPFELFTFSGGEPHIKISTDSLNTDEVTITHRIQSFNDLGEVLVAINALQNAGITAIHLFLPYFPGARQDRLMQNGEPLTAKLYADLLNQQDLKSITIFDPHSDVTPALLNRCKVINNHVFIEQVVRDLSSDTLLLSPDGGALKKIYKLAETLQTFEVVECSKIRDIKTGKLSGFKAYTDDFNHRDCLIVDDICDGGGTFIGLAKELKAKNAGNLHLAVSHGIFSRGFDELTKIFTSIYTTDSFKALPNHTQVKQIPLSNILNKQS